MGPDTSCKPDPNGLKVRAYEVNEVCSEDYTELQKILKSSGANEIMLREALGRLTAFLMRMGSINIPDELGCNTAKSNGLIGELHDSVYSQKELIDHIHKTITAIEKIG